MTTLGRLEPRHLRSLGAVAFVFAATVAGAAIFGVRINTSYSLPLGLYVRTSNPTASLVEFCPAEPFASTALARGYRTRGTGCPDGGVPLLKMIVAVPADHVWLSPQGIAVNGRLLPNTAPLTKDAAGRSLTPWPLGRYEVKPGTVWIASTYNRGSYDSRYMGPIRTSQIRGRLRPLWTL